MAGWGDDAIAKSTDQRVSVRALKYHERRSRTVGAALRCGSKHVHSCRCRGVNQERKAQSWQRSQQYPACADSPRDSHHVRCLAMRPGRWSHIRRCFAVSVASLGHLIPQLSFKHQVAEFSAFNLQCADSLSAPPMFLIFCRFPGLAIARTPELPVHSGAGRC